MPVLNRHPRRLVEYPGMGDRFKDRWSRDDDGADSLDTVELVMELEEEFDITIPDEDAVKIRTVVDAIRYIEKRRRGDAEMESS